MSAEKKNDTDQGTDEKNPGGAQGQGPKPGQPVEGEKQPSNPVEPPSSE